MLFRTLPLAALGVAVAALAVLFTSNTATPAYALTNCTAPGGGNATMVALFNAARAQAGVGPLAANALLDNAAQWIANDQVVTGALHHEPDSLGRSFASRMRDCGVSGYSGENLAWTGPDAQVAFNAWMNSPGHRANILSPYFNCVGIGYTRNYWSATFSSNCGSLSSSTPADTPTPTDTPTRTPTDTPTPTPTEPPTPFVGHVGAIARDGQP